MATPWGDDACLVRPHGRRDQNDTVAAHEEHLHCSLSPLDEEEEEEEMSE